MAKAGYETTIERLSPLAVRKGQTRVCGGREYAPPVPWTAVVACKSCEAEYLVGPNRIYGSRTTEAQCVQQLEEILAEEHSRNHPHQDAYELEG